MAFELNEEIQTEITNSPELQTALTEYFKASTFGSEYITNTNNRHFEEKFPEKIKTEVRTIYDRFDSDIKEITGVERDQKVKTYDHLKTVLTDLKGKTGDTAAMEALKQTNVELQDKLKNNEGAGHYKTLFEASEQKLVSETKAFQEKFNTLDTQHKTETIKTRLMTGMSALKFSDSVSESARESLKNQALSSLISRSSIDADDILRIKDENGNPAYQDGNIPLTAKVALETELEKFDILEKKKTQGGGGGTGDKGKTGGDDSKDIIALDLSNVRNRQDLSKAIADELKTKGIAFGTDEYKKLNAATYNAHRANYKLT